MLRHVGGPPWSSNMVAGKYCNYLNLLWLSSQLISEPSQTTFTKELFPILKLLKWLKITRHLYFWTNAILALCHAPP